MKGQVWDPQPNIPCPLQPSSIVRDETSLQHGEEPHLWLDHERRTIAVGKMVMHQLSSPPALQPSFSCSNTMGRTFQTIAAALTPPAGHLACLFIHTTVVSSSASSLWQKEIKHALEMPEIASDQDVLGPRQPQKQDVAGPGWNPASPPPGHRAGLRHGPAWTDECEEGHTDPKATPKPWWCLLMLWWMKSGCTSSSSKSSHQPLSATHHQPQPGVTQHPGTMQGSPVVQQCRRVETFSIHHPGMDLQPGGGRFQIPPSTLTTKQHNLHNITDFP